MEKTLYRDRWMQSYQPIKTVTKEELYGNENFHIKSGIDRGNRWHLLAKKERKSSTLQPKDLELTTQTLHQRVSRKCERVSVKTLK